MDPEPSKTEQDSTPPPIEDGAKGPPSFPEGGLRAWSVVAGSFCVLFCTFGYLNAYGYLLTGRVNYRPSAKPFAKCYLHIRPLRVYQDYYQEHQLSSMSSSSISWIGSVQVFLLYAGGLLGGPLFDRFGGIVGSNLDS